MCHTSYHLKNIFVSYAKQKTTEEQTKANEVVANGDITVRGGEEIVIEALVEVLAQTIHAAQTALHSTIAITKVNKIDTMATLKENRGTLRGSGRKGHVYQRCQG